MRTSGTGRLAELLRSGRPVRRGGRRPTAVERAPFRLSPAARAQGTGWMWPTRLVARMLGRVLLNLDVRGAGNVPASGGLLIAVNHTAFIDGPLVYGALPRPAVFLVKSEMFHGFVGAVLHRIGQIPIRRGVAEREPLRTALGTLAAGGVVAVFPEGSRGFGDVRRVQHGIAYLALRSSCPVVPVACHGTGQLLPAGRRWPAWRPTVRVAFGEPFRVDAGPTVTRHAVGAAADQVRATLAAHVAATRPTDLGGPSAAATRSSPLAGRARRMLGRRGSN